MKKTVSIVLSVGIAVLFVSVAVLFVWPYLPHSIDTPMTPTDTNADDTTKPTHVKQDELYFQTSPSEWFSVGEDVNWNDQPHIVLNKTAQTASAWYGVGEEADWNGEFSVCVESVVTSKALPQGIESEDIWSSDIVRAADGTLTSPHIYVDVSVGITRLAETEPELHGTMMPLCESVCVGNMHLAVYDSPNGIAETEECQTFRNLSAEFDIDHHGSVDLNVGETVRFRLIYVIREEQWDNTDVLLYPFAYIFDAYKIEHFDLDNVYILLNGKDVQE